MAAPAPTTNKQLVEEKLGNFKAFLRANSSKPETVDEMDAYTIDHFLVFGAMNLMPLAAAGNLGLAVDKTVERYGLKEEAAVKDKVKRYYEFLVAFLESVKSSHNKKE
jgi:hypothetical protein